MYFVIGQNNEVKKMRGENMDCECKLNGKYKHDLKGLKKRDNDFIFDPERNTRNMWKHVEWDAETCEILTVSTYKILSHNPIISKLTSSKPGCDWLK
jgi:hypothetical protein